MKLFKNEEQEKEFIKKVGKKIHDRHIHDSDLLIHTLDEAGFINVTQLDGADFKRLEGTIYDVLVGAYFERIVKEA